MRILAEETIVLVIDFQERLMPVIDKKEEVIQKSALLLKGLNLLKIPCIITQQYTKGLGETVTLVTEAAERYTLYEKVTFSAYENEDIRQFIQKHTKKNIIVCGAEAHICVLQTVIDLCNAGYQVLLVENCIGSRKEEDKKTALQRAVYEGAIITTYEAVLFELMRSSQHDCFKKMIALIK